MALPETSTVIPSREGAQLLARCLSALFRGLEAAGGKHEVIVVDSDSADGTIDFLHRDYPKVQIVQLPATTCFAEACNIGIAAACGKFILLLNNDMMVEPDFLPPLLVPFGDPSVFAVVPQYRMRRGMENAYICSCCGRRHGEDEAVHHSPDWRLDAPAGGGLFDGLKLRQLGGFDPLFRPFYWEDIDLGFRAWRRGWKIISAPESAMYHEEGATIGTLYSYRQVQIIYHKNRFLFAWKNLRDTAILLQHFLGLPLQLKDDLFARGGLPITLGLCQAIRQLPEAMRRRAEQQAIGGRSDREIIQQVPHIGNALARQLIGSG